MAVPDFQSVMRPVLDVHADRGLHSIAEVRDRVAAALGVTEDDRKIMLPSGGQPQFANRVAWAVTHLAQAALLERAARGITQITERGEQVLRDHPERVDVGVLSRFPEYVEFRHRTRERKGKQVSALDAVGPGDSPRDAINDLIDDAHAAVASDLLSRVVKQPPEFLEHLVLTLLGRWATAGWRHPAEHLGGPGDQGLDGLIRLDKLGLDVVYVQAKRYTDRPVGRPEIQAFVGALHGAQASRGVFITTSRFSPEAQDYADRVNARLVLIDGPELANLMIEHNCGVVVEETFSLKQVDENFFGD